jgi:DNA-binding helix-hairpin-helix protein with protein kinase domain
MIWIGVIVACVVVLLVAWREAKQRPSAVARRRLDAQIAQVEQQLAALRPASDDFAAQQEALLRARWLQEQLAATPVEAIEVPGTGPATHKALRATGIGSLGDLSKLGSVKVPTVGTKREQQLLAAYRDAHRRLSSEASQMSRAALDAYSRGALAAAIQQHDSEDLARRRQREAAELRLRDLRRRRMNLKASSGVADGASGPTLHS